jgi:hypothetical protein
MVAVAVAALGLEAAGADGMGGLLLLRTQAREEALQRLLHVHTLKATVFSAAHIRVAQERVSGLQGGCIHYQPQSGPVSARSAQFRGFRKKRENNLLPVSA